MKRFAALALLAFLAASGAVGTATFTARAADAASRSQVARVGGGGARPDVIVIGVAGLRWQDVTLATTPALWRLAADSSLGSLSVKAVPAVSCPDDGWLTLGAGNRATAESSRGCARSGVGAVVADGGGARVGNYPDVAKANRHLDDATRLGALADALAGAGECISGAGRGGALAAADSAGRVGNYRPDAVEAAADAAFLRACPVTVIGTSAADADRVVAAASAAAPPDSVTLVAGVSETAGTDAHLHVALAHGRTFAPTSLTSASTRRAPFVQLVDLAPTILDLRGVQPPQSMIGQPWRSSGPARAALGPQIRQLTDQDVAARQQLRAVVPFWWTVVALMVVVSGAAWVSVRRRPSYETADADAGQLRPRLDHGYAVACAAIAMLPADSFLAGLVPWWHSGHPLVALFAATAAAGAVTTAAAVVLERLDRRRAAFRLAGAVGAVTAGVIGLDLLTGAHLQIFTMAGYSPLVAGRFAGIGNVAFGLYASGALLLGAGTASLARNLARRRPDRAAVAAVGLVGVVAVAIDGAPPWGSDVGGVLALVPAFAVLGWTVGGVRVSIGKAVAGAAAAVGAVAVLGVIDYARPAAHQTHLGRFVGEVLHGGAWTVVRRKAIADGALLTHSALTLLIPLLVIAGVWVVRRPPAALARGFEREPVLRPALVSLLVMAVVGAVVNDSGIAIPALAVLVVLPATVSVVVGCAAPAATREQPEHGHRLLR